MNHRRPLLLASKNVTSGKADRSRRCLLEVEPLTDRILPAIATSFRDGVLQIVSDIASDRMVLTQSGESILLNGRVIRGGPTVANTTLIRMRGNDGNDILRVTLPDFTGQVQLEGNVGNDLLEGGPTMDWLLGGWGQDTLRGGGGMDQLYGGYGPDFLNGGADFDYLVGDAGRDTLYGGDGDDWFDTRDYTHRDFVYGEAGQDSVRWDSYDDYAGCEIWNPHADYASPLRLKVLVLNFDPRVPSEGNQFLHEVFGWADPHAQVARFQEEIFRTSGGFVTYDVVDWRDIDDIPVKADGFDYSVEQYVQNWRSNSGWHPADQVDYLKIFRDFNVAERVRHGEIDEVVFLGGPYFGYGESAMAGPGAFYINGPTFPEVDSGRAFAVMGLNYERGFETQLHGLGHRVEATMAHIYGGWQADQLVHNWARFAANAFQSRGVAAVGSVHYPPNGRADYDYNSSRLVYSSADQWLTYGQPSTGTTIPKIPVTASLWARDGRSGQDGYLNWWFAHLPRGYGVNADLRQNNWWKHVFDFNNYTADGLERAPQATLDATDLGCPGGSTYAFRVAYASANGVFVDTLDSQDVRVTGPNGFDQFAQLVGVNDDTAAGSYRVATYQINVPDGTWDVADFGAYTVTLESGQVGAQGFGDGWFPGGVLGTFRITDEHRLDINGLVAGGAATVTASAWDIGQPSFIFDGQTETLYRSAAIDPAQIQIVFAAPQTLARFLVMTASGPHQFKLETAASVADLESQSGSYAEIVPWRSLTGDQYDEVMLDTPVTASVLRLSVGQPLGDDYIHIREWAVFTQAEC